MSMVMARMKSSGVRPLLMTTVKCSMLSASVMATPSIWETSTPTVPDWNSSMYTKKKAPMLGIYMMQPQVKSSGKAVLPEQITDAA